MRCRGYDLLFTAPRATLGSGLSTLGAAAELRNEAGMRLFKVSRFASAFQLQILHFHATDEGAARCRGRDSFDVLLPRAARGRSADAPIHNLAAQNDMISKVRDDQVHLGNGSVPCAMHQSSEKMFCQALAVPTTAAGSGAHHGLHSRTPRSRGSRCSL